MRHNFLPTFPGIADAHQIDKLAGDGSTRSYYRVLSGKKTYVLQTNGSDDLNYRRFLEAYGFYANQGIPVPKVLAHHDLSRWILLEDLGSDDLQSLASYDHILHSVKLLRHLAPVSVENAFEKSWLAERTLDEARFVFEMNHFIEHFVEKLAGEKASEPLKKDLFELAARAARGPRVFCHRDYQSRNLMKGSQQPFVMIDFQDSQWGPALYDAVSLCWDPYFVLGEDEREELFAEYLKSLDLKTLNANFQKLLQDEIATRELKEMLILERFVKAVGSFASFKTTRGKDTHLVYIEDSFRTVAAALKRAEPLGIRFPTLHTKVGEWLKLAERQGWSRLT
ncbi:MAG TPA: phosphotransferase [Bdellovibrionota bacterium]|nr:phosphotransferase [Bdellovibrionota bacterium]